MTHFLLLLAALVAAAPPGVQLPPGQDAFGERTIILGQNGSVEEATPPDRVFSSFAAEQLPPSDRAKWHITVYVDSRDPESRNLLRDFDRHESLKVLRDWAKYNIVDRSASEGQASREVIAELEQADLPTVMVYADPRDPVFGKQGPGGWTYAHKSAGYGGDAALLARNIYDALVTAYKEHRVTGQCPGPYCPPRPDRPDWDPYRPNDDAYTPDDWDTPGLPDWDLSPQVFPREVLWIGAGLVLLVILLRRFGAPPPPAKLLVLLAICYGLAASPCLAGADPPIDTQQSPEQLQQIDTDQAATQLSEDELKRLDGITSPPSTICPGCPGCPYIDWSDPYVAHIVRDEIRRALRPVDIERDVGRAIDAIRADLSTWTGFVRSDITRRLDRLLRVAYCVLILNALTAILVIWRGLR